MTVKQLKEMLSGVPNTYHVLMSSDPEGNSFSDLYEGSLETFLPGTTEPDDDATGEEPNVLLLWPRE